MSRLCSHCGNKTSVKAIYCLKCGARINSYSLLHAPPIDREYLLGGKFERNFSSLSIISFVLFVIALFPLLMAFVHDRFWLVFIGFFPYNLYTILITIIGAFFGYLSRDTSSGKIGLIINCLYLLASIIYLFYNVWIFMASPLYQLAE